MCVLGDCQLERSLDKLKKMIAERVIYLGNTLYFSLPQILCIITAVGSNVTCLNFSENLCSLPEV